MASHFIALKDSKSQLRRQVRTRSPAHVIKFTLDKPAATTPLQPLHITYNGLKSQSSVVLHTLWKQNAARTSSEQQSHPTYRPTNLVSSRKPQRYTNTLKTSNREMDRD